MSRHDHHPPCPNGCGELADECACPSPNPLGSMTIEPPVGSEGRPVPSRAHLVELCVKGVVPVTDWRNRDTAAAQRQLAEAWALLLAGCDYALADSPSSDERTWWINITFPGFARFDYDGGHDVELFYIPTKRRLEQAAGGDWY